MEFDEKWLNVQGFNGPIKISQLMDEEDSENYFKGFEKGGIYIVINDTKEKEEEIFDEKKIEYSLNSKYNSYDPNNLQEKWRGVKNHYILYIDMTKNNFT